MIFLSTPFSKEAADRLNKMKVPAFKIGSGECNNYPLIEYVCRIKKPIILSTGMNTINQIRESVRIIEKYKISYALMHTTNLYPTPYNLIRLNALKEMKKLSLEAVDCLITQEITVHPLQLSYGCLNNRETFCR